MDRERRRIPDGRPGQGGGLIGNPREFANLGASQGGYNEDREFYGYRMPI